MVSEQMKVVLSMHNRAVMSFNSRRVANDTSSTMSKANPKKRPANAEVSALAAKKRIKTASVGSTSAPHKQQTCSKGRAN